MATINIINNVGYQNGFLIRHFFPLSICVLFVCFVGSLIFTFDIVNLIVPHFREIKIGNCALNLVQTHRETK